MRDNAIIINRSNGAIEVNQNYEITVGISNDYGFVENVTLVVYKEGSSNPINIKMPYKHTEEKISFFQAKTHFNEIGIYYFAISLTINGNIIWIKYNPDTMNPFLTCDDMPYWKIVVCAEKFTVPKWAQGATIYHIMVDRFAREKKLEIAELPNRILREDWGTLPIWKPDSNGEVKNNDFFCGNLLGIDKYLEYIKSLGVDILYLSPICASQSNHRYDTADYEEIDPYVGKKEDLKNLCYHAHQKGMKVILDSVFNHTGNLSRYFNEDGGYSNSIGAFQSKNSPYYDWYQKYNENFCYWWGFKNLPVMNQENIAWQNYIFGINGVIDQWFELGIDGLRIDVADELSDKFIEKMHEAVARNGADKFILGEVWENAVLKEKDGKRREYLLNGKGLHSVMNYPYTDAILKYVRFGDWRYFKSTVLEIINDYPKQAAFSMMNALSTHDIPRAITTLEGSGIEYNKYQWTWDIPYGREWQAENDILVGEKYHKAKRKFKVATIIQYFLPGSVSIFYGDEVGVHGYKDPFNRKCYPWKFRDKELLNFFKKLGKVRKKVEFLRTAELKFIYTGEDMIIFERYNEKNKVIIAVNRTEKTIEIPREYKNSEVIFKMNSDQEKLYGFGAIVIRKS